MTHLKHLVAAAAVLVTMQAQAYEVWLTSGPVSLVQGAITETFDGPPVFSRAGGTVFSSSSPNAHYYPGADIWAVPGSAQPSKGGEATNDAWLSLLNNQTATFSFAPGNTYVGFLWGSVDTYNTVSVYDSSSNLIAAFSGGAGGLAAHEVSPAGGNQGASVYFNFYAPSVGSVTFASSENSFEIDNVSAVPEPETYALMLAGLGAVIFITCRRKL